MALLDSVLEVRDASKSTGGNYLNPSSIDKDQTVRITILGTTSLGGYECWVTKEGKRFSMKFKTEPTRDDLKERADEEGVELTGDEKPKGFYAFWIWNYEEECVQVFQFSQQGLIDPIISNLSDEEISQEPHAYDFKLSNQRAQRTRQALQRRLRTRQASSGEGQQRDRSGFPRGAERRR